jgi:hypothetical protein
MAAVGEPLTAFAAIGGVRWPWGGADGGARRGPRASL